MARNYSTRKRILVTGGAGFLGSHLIDRLLSDGHEVLCVDNLFTGAKRNIEHLLSNPRFEFMRHDVTFPLFVEVDEIYNLACPASPVHYQHDPCRPPRRACMAPSTCSVSPSGRAFVLLGLVLSVPAKLGRPRWTMERAESVVFDTVTGLVVSCM